MMKVIAQIFTLLFCVAKPIICFMFRCFGSWNCLLFTEIENIFNLISNFLCMCICFEKEQIILIFYVQFFFWTLLIHSQYNGFLSE